MDPLLLILGIIGYAIVSAIANIAEKKKRRAQEEEARRTGQPLPTHSGPAGQQPWQGSMQDWQEQLRRMLNPEESQGRKPPVIHTMVDDESPAPPLLPPGREPVMPRARAGGMMAPAKALHEKASQLQEQVARRVQVIEQQKTEVEKSVKSDLPQRAAPRKAAPRVAMRRAVPFRPASGHGAIALLRNRETIRDAVVASVILGPPKALEPENRLV